MLPKTKIKHSDKAYPGREMPDRISRLSRWHNKQICDIIYKRDMGMFLVSTGVWKPDKRAVVAKSTLKVAV